MRIEYDIFVGQTNVGNPTRKNGPSRPAFQGSLIGTDTALSATYDLLLVIHINHEPISYRFPYKGRKLQTFPTLVLTPPQTGIL